MRLRLTLALSLLAPALVPALTTATAAGTPPAATSVAGGYWTLGVDGHVTGFGDATAVGDPKVTLGSTPAVDLEPAGSDGYWILDRSGRVHPFGSAVDHGDATGLMSSGEQATSLSAAPTGKGYWVFTDKGRSLSFGDAVHHGDMAGTALNAPVLDSVVTETGQGYWMVAADGGIFTFGDADFHGSTGNIKLNAPVQSLVPDGDGDGYWLVASDGGIFSFDAPFRGSMGGTPLNKPVTGMVRYGNGYLMVAEDGGIFTFSDLPFAGSLGDKAPVQPIVAVAAPRPQTPAETPTTEAPGIATTTTTAPPATTTTTAPVSAASVPPGEPTHVFACEDGSGEAARLWYYGNDTPDGVTSWGADNACSDRWIVLGFPGESVSDPYGSALSIAPGAQFNDEFACPGQVCISWTPDGEGSERIGLSNKPMDGFTGGCPAGWGLWQVRAGVNQPFEPYGRCPDADDYGWHHDEDEPDPDYDGPVCFHRQPDVIGTDQDDILHAVDTNGDGDHVVIGNGGNDRFEHLTTDGTTPSDVFFCGGDGDDQAHGWANLYDGGAGTDSAYLYDCHPNGRIAGRANVESVHTGQYPCTTSAS